MEYSFHSVISPKSLTGTPKKFEFESQSAKDYVETLEENLSHHGNLLIHLLQKQNLELDPVDKDLVPSLSIEEVIKDILDLHQKLKSVENERTLAVSKTLLNDLLQHEHTEKINEITSEYEEYLQEAKFHIDRKDKLIYDLQKQNSELELQVTYRQNSDGTLIVPLKQEILDLYTCVEEVREYVSYIDEEITFGTNYKEFLVEFYKRSWKKTQILQALLRNPVNLKEGFSKSNRLNIENEEPDVTIEFEESDIDEPGHYRACTLSNDSFENPAHKRHTLSSGKELIIAVRSKLVSKIEFSERKIGLFAIDIQKHTDELNETAKEVLDLTQENTRLLNILRKKN